MAGEESRVLEVDGRLRWVRLAGRRDSAWVVRRAKEKIGATGASHSSEEPATGCLYRLGPCSKASCIRCYRRRRSSSFGSFRPVGCIWCWHRGAAKRQRYAAPVAILLVSSKRLWLTPSSKTYAISPATAITPVLNSTTVAPITVKLVKVIFIDFDCRASLI